MLASDRGHAIREQCRQLLSRDGLADQEALRLRATMFLEESQLLLRLDALARRSHSKPVAHGYDGPHDDTALIALADVGDERPVELHPVERKFEQVAERRIARSKIVDRNADAQ